MRRALLLLLLPVLGAWIRVPYEDVEVVTRSELIVVGHLKPDSIQRVDHVPEPRRGASWEHHTTLVITETLKGKATATEIPIVIDYGLDVLIDGNVTDAQNTVIVTGTCAKGSVQIVDTGNTSGGGARLVPDASQDNLWFLRKRSRIPDLEPGIDNYAIDDPEDLRPLADKAYLTLYLAADPEPGVEAYATKHDDVRARRYLQHMTIARIARMAEPGERVDKLLPYFEHGLTGRLQHEAMEAVLAAGADASGPRLRKLFPTADHSTRMDIITIWGRTRYKGAVEILVKLLETSDRFWAAQHLTGGWWNADVESAVTKERRDRYFDVYDAVIALGQIGDARARRVIQLTFKRWHAIGFDDRQMVEACVSAMM
jgi:hypothetical protein